MRPPASWQWWWGGFVVVVVVVGCARAAAEALWLRPRRLERHFERQGVRGPGYRFFVGSSVELVGLMKAAAARPMAPPTSHDILPRVLAFYHHWRKLYGPMHLIWFGTTARLTVSKPELIRKVLMAPAEHFDRYEAHPLICQFEGYGLSNIHGERWARRRRILSPAFYADNIKLLVPFVGETVRRMLDELPTSGGGGGGGGEAEVDVAEWFGRVPQEVITFATFGRRDYDDGEAVFELQGELAGLAADAHSKVYIPGYRFLPLRRNLRVWRLVREIRESLASIVTNLEQQADDGGGGHDRRRDGGMRNFMSFMAPAMAADEIIEETKNFFFAGKETLVSLLTWTTVALAMHPEWQDLARREVLAVVGRRDLPSKDHLPKLKTLGMIVNETLRLYPPAVAMIRTAKRDVELGGCAVPAGTEILIPIMAVHHDEEAWGADAAEFNPARFEADVDGGGGRPRRHPMAFIPFGGGARVCIGQSLALTEAKAAMAVVLQRFAFRLSPAYVHAPRVLMILGPQHGAPVIFRPL